MCPQKKRSPAELFLLQSICMWQSRKDTRHYMSGTGTARRTESCTGERGCTARNRGPELSLKRYLWMMFFCILAARTACKHRFEFKPLPASLRQHIAAVPDRGSARTSSSSCGTCITRGIVHAAGLMNLSCCFALFSIPTVRTHSSLSIALQLPCKNASAEL